MLKFLTQKLKAHSINEDPQKVSIKDFGEIDLLKTLPIGNKTVGPFT